MRNSLCHSVSFTYLNVRVVQNKVCYNLKQLCTFKTLCLLDSQFSKFLMWSHFYSWKICFFFDHMIANIYIKLLYKAILLCAVVQT